MTQPNLLRPGRVTGIPANPLDRRRRVRAVWVRNVAVFGSVIVEVVQRLIDLLVALGLLLALSPLLALRAAGARQGRGRVFDRQTLVGRFRTPFERLSFAGDGFGGSLAVLFNVLRGDMAFAGPRALTPTEAQAVSPRGQVRFEVRPGLVSPHALRSRTGVAYEAEEFTDRDFVYGETVRGDVGLMARAVPSLLLGGHSQPVPPPFLDFFGVSIVNTTMEAAVDWILEQARQPQPSLLAFVNPDCLNIAYSSDSYRSILRDAARVLPDGIGIHLGCRLLGTSLAANVNGTDLFPRLCERLAATELSIFLLGARPGVAADAAAAMQARYPGLRVAGVRDGYFGPDEEADVIAEINASSAQILLVAFGVPRQELWLAANQDRLRPAVRIGVGGLFDFYSGRIPRAPQWMREIGLEWVWRFLQEPGRMWRRYLIGNPLFLYRVWRQARGALSLGVQKRSNQRD